MEHIPLMKVKSIWGDLKGLLSQIPLAETDRLVDEFLVTQLNITLDNLKVITDTDFSSFKIPEIKRVQDWPQKFPTDIVRAQLGRIINKLEAEYGFGQENQPRSPGIVIFNKNESEISLKINYSIHDLISKSSNDETKAKLNELNTELNKTDKNWDIIKNILIWIINFSKDLFLEVLPIILQKNI